MRWEMSSPCRGDMIRVDANGIFHYGIFVSDDEVIQFGPNPSSKNKPSADETEVMAVDVNEFLLGGFLQVGRAGVLEQRKMRCADEIVRTARRRVGERGYHILYNNCEHFVNECVFGTHTSSQIDSVRAFFAHRSFVHVYTSKIPESIEDETVYPPERDAYIKMCTSEKTRRDRLYAWKVLEQAMKRSLRRDMKDIAFQHMPSGMWMCDACCFSISHTDNAVAVAVSSSPIGVDIEPAGRELKKLYERMLSSEEEYEYAECTPEEECDYLTIKWTQKESVFKQVGGKSFIPKEIVPGEGVRTTRITLGGSDYWLSVSSREAQQLRIFEV